MSSVHIAFIVPIVLAFLLSFVNAGPTLIPPSTFESATSTAPGNSTTASPSATVSHSGNNSMSATPTSSAQFPSLSGFSICVTTCLQLAVGVNCSSVTNVNCYCPSTQFTQQIVNCTTNSCPSELTTAESLAQRFCKLANQSSSLSFPSTTSRASSTLTSSPVSTNTAPSSTTAAGSTSTSNAASSSSFVGSGNLGSSTFLGMGVAILGILLGALLVE